MSATATKPEKPEKPEVKDLTAIVKANYIRHIGQPERLQKVNALQITHNKWRCTCWVHTENGPSVGPTHFITVDEDGNILAI